MSPFDHNHFSSPCSSSCHLWVTFNHNYLFIIIYTLTQNHHLPARHCCFWRTVGVFKDIRDRLDVWGGRDVVSHVWASVWSSWLSSSTSTPYVLGSLITIVKKWSYSSQGKRCAARVGLCSWFSSWSSCCCHTASVSLYRQVGFGLLHSTFSSSWSAFCCHITSLL